MRKLLIILGVVVVVGGIAFVASQLLRQDAPAPVIIPSASPTAGPITSVGDLYEEEVRLNDLDVDGADAAYEEAVKAAQ